MRGERTQRRGKWRNTIILNEYYTIILENTRGKKGEVGEEAGPPQVR